MASKQIIEARVRQKTDTLANWMNNDLILLGGEPAYILNTDGTPVNFKIGDGTKTFAQLPNWIAYDQAAYSKVTGTTLPASDGQIHYTILGAGTYTQTSGGNVFIPAGSLGIVSNNGTTWSIDNTVVLPTVDISGKLDTGGYVGTAQDLYDNKLDKGAYGGTAEDLSVSIQTLGNSIPDVLNTLYSENTVDALAVDSGRQLNEKIGSISPQITSDFFTISGYHRSSTTGLLVSSANSKTTQLIPFIVGNTLSAIGLTSGGGKNQVNFYNETGVFISSLNFSSSVSPIIVNSSNTPVGTFFIALNSSPGVQTSLIINGLKPLINRLEDTEALAADFDDQIADANLQLSGNYFTIPGYVNLTGQFITSANQKRTDYLALTPSDVLVATGLAKGGSYHQVACFDSNKNFISTIEFASNVTTFTLNSGNIPANTAFVILNSLTANATTVVINGQKVLKDTVADNSAAISSLNSQVSGYDVRLNGLFKNIGYWGLTGNRNSTDTRFLTTDKLPFIQGDYLQAFGTGRTASFRDIDFYDSSGNHISGISLPSTTPVLIVNSSNTPANTAFITLNKALASYADVRINRITDLTNLSINASLHMWRGVKVCSYGDSNTASNGWQPYLVGNLGIQSYARGVGSSAVTENFTGVAIKPDGEYIDRRTAYNSDAEFIAALESKGYTNLVTSPTWLEYSNATTPGTLPAGSYFLISAQLSGQERVNTIPRDSEVILVMVGTNDEKNPAYIGQIDDYGDGAGGLTKNFIGSYRQMINLIRLRCPKAKIILLNYMFYKNELVESTRNRTTVGINSGLFRDAIRDISDNYGLPLIDVSKIMNPYNIWDLFTDGAHPNPTGFRVMGNGISKELEGIGYSKY